MPEKINRQKDKSFFRRLVVYNWQQFLEVMEEQEMKKKWMITF